MKARRVVTVRGEPHADSDFGIALCVVTVEFRIPIVEFRSRNSDLGIPIAELRRGAYK